MDFYCMYNSHTKYCDRIHYTPYRKTEQIFFIDKKDDTFHIYYLSIYSLSTFLGVGGDNNPKYITPMMRSVMWT